MRYLLVAAVALACLGRAEASNGHWQPPHVIPSRTSLATVFAALDSTAGTPDPGSASRRETYDVDTADGTHFRALASIRDDDFAIDAALRADVYRMGRAHDHRWRARPGGVRYEVRADSQGDDLDRWPLAVLGFERPNCTLLGETNDGTAWVIEDRPPFDSPHWLYVDKASGGIRRELFREGANVVDFEFPAAGIALGVRRPLAWTVTGGGASERVTVSSVAAATLSAAEIALPPVRALSPSGPPVAMVELPAHFAADRHIQVDVRVNGEPRTFELDDGTPSIDVAAGDARALRGSAVLGHGIVDALDVGPLRFDHVPVHALDPYPGILGYDFFTSGVIEIDYTHERVRWFPRDTFVPPAGAVPLEANFDEAIPLVPMAIGTDAGTRFCPDLGSDAIVLLRYFAEDDGASYAYATNASREFRTGYLEGDLEVSASDIPPLQFGNVSISGLRGLIEVPNAGVTTDFALDGIVGVGVLAGFDWWFDATGNRIWYRTR